MIVVPAKGTVQRNVLTFALGGFLAAGALAVLLLSSVVIYLVFAWLYTPVYTVRTPVDFVYRSANVTWPHEDTPKALVTLPDIPLAAVDYRVSFEIEVYNTRKCRDTCNLVVGFIVSDKLDDIIDHDDESRPVKSIAQYTQAQIFRLRDAISGAVTSKSTSVAYHSRLLEQLDTLVFAPLYLSGYRRQTSRITLDIFDLLSSPSLKYNYMGIHVDRMLAIASASLVWTARLKGIRYLLYHHPIPCFLIGTTLIFTSLTVGLFASLVYFLLSQRKQPDIAEKSARPKPPAAAATASKPDWLDRRNANAKRTPKREGEHVGKPLAPQVHSIQPDWLDRRKAAQNAALDTAQQKKRWKKPDKLAEGHDNKLPQEAELDAYIQRWSDLVGAVEESSAKNAEQGGVEREEIPPNFTAPLKSWDSISKDCREDASPLNQFYVKDEKTPLEAEQETGLPSKDAVDLPTPAAEIGEELAPAVSEISETIENPTEHSVDFQSKHTDVPSEAPYQPSEPQDDT